MMKNSSNQSINCGNDDVVGRSMYPTAYSVFFIVGFPANCLSLYVACLLVQKGNTVAVYLINLSVSDLLYTITLPVWIELSFRRPVDDTLCSLIAVVMYNSFYVGAGFLCCISVDRYLALVYPLYFSQVREVRTAMAVSALVWGTEMMVHVALLAHSGALASFSARRLCDERMPMDRADATVAIVRVVLGFLLPCSLMVFCFQQIMKSLRKSTSLEATACNKIRNLLLLLLLTYVIAFMPYQAVMLLRAMLEPPENCTLRDYYMVFVATTTINSVADPIIYCLVSESAQAELKGKLLNLRVALRLHWFSHRDTVTSSTA